MKIMLLGMFIALTYIGPFYLGYSVAIDIFEWACFTTGGEEKTWLQKLLHIQETRYEMGTCCIFLGERNLANGRVIKD